MNRRISVGILSVLLVGCRTPEPESVSRQHIEPELARQLPERALDAPAATRRMYRSDADVLGVSNFRSHSWLILEGPGITNVSMAKLEDFPALNRLTLRSTNVTDAGLVYLASLPNLGKLKLSANPGVTEAGMASIAELDALYWLDFESQLLTAQGLANLGPMPGLRRLHLAYPQGIKPILPGLTQFEGLERLYIQSPQLEDAHLSALQGPSRVFVLDLSGSPIGGEGLRFLSGFTALRELYLRYTGVRDEGLGHLPPLSRLQVLDLHGTQLGDAGLSELVDCRSIRHLYLGETRVSQSAELELKARCPNMEVHRAGGSPRGAVP